MFVSQEAVKMPRSREDRAEEPFPFGLLALKRQTQFHDFLLHELLACRTETERKVVLSVLLTTKVRMQRLTESLNLSQEESVPGKETAGGRRGYSS